MPSETPVAIGDGSFQYSVQSIWNAARLHLPMLIVVLRNEEYAILKSFAVLEQTPGVPGLDLPGIDIVSLARGYGCDAARLEDIGAIKCEERKRQSDFRQARFKGCVPA